MQGGSGWGGGQGGCEWRSKAFVKIQKKNFFFLGGMGGRVSWEGGIGLGGQGGWERRSEACVKIKKKKYFFFLGGGGWGSGWGVRVDVNGEVKLL